MRRYDTAVLNGTAVIPYAGTVRCDVGIRDGRIAALADSTRRTTRAPSWTPATSWCCRGRCRGPREWRSHTRQQAGSSARSTRRRDSAAPRCSTHISSSEGHLPRGLGLIRVAELASANPARAFGLYPCTGAIAVGRDAALVVLHPNREQIVTPEVLCSAQDFTPFAGMRVRGWPTHTLLRGRTVFQDGAVRGRPQGGNTSSARSVCTCDGVSASS